jgi:uncharacterized membrane protein YbhN (UPF0104 family)
VESSGKPDATVRRRLSLAGWAVVSVALLALLFLKLDISLADLGVAFGNTPAWLLLVVLGATAVIQAITSWRWKIAIDWLSPDHGRLRFLELLNATTVGTALGQVLPMQVSLSLGRWWLARETRGKWIVGTTLYEQMFDLVVLLAGGIGAAVAISLSAAPAVSLAVFAIAVACGTLAVRHAFSTGHWVAVRMAGFKGLMGALGAKLVAPLGTARAAPTRVLVLLGTTSIAKLLLLVVRAVAIAAVFAPAARLWTVAIGYPLIGLAVANPFTPGALGVAEWSWVGLLILAGSSATAAGVAAIVLRVMNLSALGVVLVAAGGLARVRKRLERPAASLPAGA